MEVNGVLGEVTSVLICALVAAGGAGRAGWAVRRWRYGTHPVESYSWERGHSARVSLGNTPGSAGVPPACPHVGGVGAPAPRPRVRRGSLHRRCRRFNAREIARLSLSRLTRCTKHWIRRCIQSPNPQKKVLAPWTRNAMTTACISRICR